MSIFASKTPRDLNPHGVIMTGAGTLPLCLCGWQRRRLDGPTLAEHIAEFDHVQSNEPNPILVEFRVAADVDFTWATARMLDALTYDHRAPEAMREVVRRSLPEARDHARRVLTRLANLAQIGA